MADCLSVYPCTQENKTNLKSKFLNTFRNYSNIKHPYKYKDVVKRLAENKNICLLKQDKGKGIVIMNRSKYVEKCEEFLNGSRFDKVEDDPTGTFEKRVQDLLRSIKKRFDPVTYRKIYPTSSRPGLFYGTAKIHKMSEDSRNVDELPVRPIVSSIGTATYETSKYLAQLLAPIAKSRYTVDSTKEFIGRIRRGSVGDEFDMVSFDVTSLFTNVPLDFTIDVILKKIYREKKIKTKLKKEEMRQLLNICTKDMHFTFNGKIYKQNDGVCMGNPLGPVIANIFMVELECSLVPTLSDILPEWIRYVDDTFTYVRKGHLDTVLNALNAFHQDIKFTHETEANGCIPFLDVKIPRKTDENFITSVYRKKTNSNTYINWNSHAPRTWKIGTLHGLLQRAYTICSEDPEVEKEIEFLIQVFSKTNGYPMKIIRNTVAKVREKNSRQSEPETEKDEENEDNNSEDVYRPHMSLPYGGEKGNTVIGKFKRALEHLLPETVKPDISVKGMKISSLFRLKDAIDDKHTSGFIYRFNCNRQSCKSRYTGETGRRKEVREREHGYTDKQSAIYQHCESTKHAKARSKNFTVVARNYPHWRRRKICEAMYIRDENPDLNKQGDKHRQSYKLELFN